MLKCKEWLKNNTEVTMELVNEVNSYDGSLMDFNFQPMEMFDEAMSMLEYSPMDLALKLYYGEFNPNDEYFDFDGLGNIASFTAWERDGWLRDNIDEIYERIMANINNIGLPIEFAEVLVEEGLID